MELVIIFLIVLLIFGGKKIPEIAKGLGKGIREFRSAQSETNKIEDNVDQKSSDKIENKTDNNKV